MNKIIASLIVLGNEFKEDPDNNTDKYAFLCNQLNN